MADDDDDQMRTTKLFVHRADDRQGPARDVLVPPGADIEDVRRLAFRAAYPGNDEMPL